MFRMVEKCQEMLKNDEIKIQFVGKVPEKKSWTLETAGNINYVGKCGEILWRFKKINESGNPLIQFMEASNS